MCETIQEYIEDAAARLAVDMDCPVDDAREILAVAVRAEANAVGQSWRRRLRASRKSKDSS